MKINNIEMFKDVHLLKLLDSIGESIIFADDKQYIRWINSSAKEILSKIGPYLNIHTPEEFIGVNLSKFHGPRQDAILAKGIFPHNAQIKLFSRFSAKIIVDQVLNEKNEPTGYILTWKDVTDFEEELQNQQKILKSLYTPIIGTAIDSVLLVALTGLLTEERMQYTKDSILLACAQKKAEYIIFDFTGIVNDVDEVIVFHLDQIAEALKLMGSEAIFVGLNAQFVQQMIRKGLSIRVKTCQSFKQGVQYVWKKKGYQLVKI
ncbi:STAS domain-containing protein [Sutcliffiella halmapala]|uniref:STAS domain-containing protein n=1 Tax=Sutcliffiella halmapala TaxID=79882 RepID=UPI000994F6D6|nr:STAS domain-containing protein [Sutcliffiella halmapala]